MKKAADIMRKAFKDVDIVSMENLTNAEKSFKRFEQFSERIKKNFESVKGSK